SKTRKKNRPTIGVITAISSIRNIRQKLTAAGAASSIETVHGVGFRLGSCSSA
ncbi:MAG: helix-turn-helix domain-containing protein, partial [Pseudomonadota bacterium]